MSDTITTTPAAAPTDDMDTTPLMKQYRELKAQAGDALLLFRMGDFYELFGDDAVEASRILEITLTSRDKNKPNPLPMAGMPYHSLSGYMPRLLKAGKKVAICEQFVEQSELTDGQPGPKGKTIVRRAIVRMLTPGIQFDLEGSEACYIACAIPSMGPGGAKLITLACLDASTGESLIGAPMDAERAQTELSSLAIRHLIRLPGVALAAPYADTLMEELPPNYLSASQAEEALKRCFDVERLDAFMSAFAAAPESVLALGILVTYVARSQRQERLSHLRPPAPLRRPQAMVLGPRTAQHLDLLPSPDGTPSLFELINRTRSALGARQLRRWMLAPLLDAREITARQDAVREILQSRPSLRERLSATLTEIYDLERITGRVDTRLANPRDTLALGRSLQALGNLPTLLGELQAPAMAELRGRLEASARATAELSAGIVREQREDAPLVARDGGIFNRGTSPELDRLISISEDGNRWLVEREAREREATGIGSLKVRYNRVFGYYIEVTQAHLKSVPAHYQRKQTTVGAERFFTEELKKFEDDFVNASARQKALEAEMFEALVARIRASARDIMDAARALGELDSLASLSRLADESGWVFPTVDASIALEIRAGRHPMVDAASRGKFVPNDLALGGDGGPEARTARILTVTGPNMGGKSTVMRQAALIVVLGQMGGPVPAVEARWGAVSALYTRIGAHDAIARGQSTFMVEMSELAHILHHADERSLIILDEIGRGTSTYDGISVAWSTLEWICSNIKARTLFATHYHELTKLAGTLPLLANAHMAVEQGERPNASEKRNSLRFLYELRDGPTNDSFGIHVAAIAGLPKPVVARAWKVLEELERGQTEHGTGAWPGQLSLFGEGATPEPESRAAEPATPHPAVQELETADLDAMTPLQALCFVARLKDLARGAETATAP